MSSGTLWGGPHATVTAAAIEWVKSGTFNGHSSGSFMIDSGVVSEAACTLQ